jgi:hypothetical protein
MTVQTITFLKTVLLRTPSTLTTRTQYSTLSLRCRGSNEWIVGGDMT